MKITTIDLFMTQYGWFATFYDDFNFFDVPRTDKIEFTRHANACDVERAMAAKYPYSIIYVIGG